MMVPSKWSLGNFRAASPVKSTVSSYRNDFQIVPHDAKLALGFLLEKAKHLFSSLYFCSCLFEAGWKSTLVSELLAIGRAELLVHNVILISRLAL